MQPNSFTLSVDTKNDTTTIVDLTYDRFEENQNRSVYIGPDHSLTLRNMINLYRTFPTTNGNFKGVAKSAVKLTQDVVVPGVDESTSITKPVIIDVAISMPVGVSEADALALRQRAVSLLDLDTIMTELQSKLMI